MKEPKWKGYGWIKQCNNEIWKPFDSSDPLEWILIGFGIGAVFILTLVGVFDWISQ